MSVLFFYTTIQIRLFKKRDVFYSILYMLEYNIDFCKYEYFYKHSPMNNLQEYLQ